MLTRNHEACSAGCLAAGALGADLKKSSSGALRAHDRVHWNDSDSFQSSYFILLVNMNSY